MSSAKSTLRDAYCEIPLQDGKVAIVDPDDYHWLRLFRWHYHGKPGKWYARAYIPSYGFEAEMHRVILGAPKSLLVDHVDGDGLNNRRQNIRLATRAQNGFNRPGAKNSTSRYKGVSRIAGSKLWRATIRKDGRYVCLGRFQSEAEAARVYDAVAADLHGEFAYLNFPPEPPVAFAWPGTPPLDEPRRKGGRPCKPWYWVARDAWYVTFQNRQVRLARGKHHEAEAIEAFRALRVAHGQACAATQSWDLNSVGSSG